ncbi:4Fe-4S single cluster domain-containing protein [Candidatus Uabimicrobium sp. HlEnr_7]|uniref:4Fe-4S single cluster domain-containing protein n=1 Tax=Candidatus Uabimicrobium helgolandensis TaxID=3095367 RepID=UPI003558E0C5
MRIAQIIDKTQVEGPGLRTAIWVQGCTLNCPGCCNQEYLPRTGGKEWCAQKLSEYCAKLNVDGITLLGGEPLQQPEEVKKFLQYLRKMCDLSVMLFTGYTWKYIKTQPTLMDIISLCDLVVAGPYIQKYTPTSRRWIGSENQTIHFVTERYQHLQGDWEYHRNEVEFHIKDGEIIVNGTPFDTGIL